MNDFDGITFGDKSIEDFLTDEKTKEIAAVKDDKHYLKSKGKVRYMDSKEPHGEVKNVPQSDLNK